MSENQSMNIDIVPNQSTKDQVQHIESIKRNLSDTGKVLEDCQGGQEELCTTYDNLKEIIRKLEYQKQQVNNYTLCV